MTTPELPTNQPSIMEWTEKRKLTAELLELSEFDLHRARAEKNYPKGYLRTFYTLPSESEIKAYAGGGCYDLVVKAPGDDYQGLHVVARFNNLRIPGAPQTPADEQQDSAARGQAAVADRQAVAEERLTDKLLAKALAGLDGGGQGQQQMFKALESTTTMRVEIAQRAEKEAVERARAAEERMKRMAEEHTAQVAAIIADFNKQLTEARREAAKDLERQREHFTGLMAARSAEQAASLNREIQTVAADRDHWLRRCERLEEEVAELRKEVQDELRRKAEQNDVKRSLSDELGHIKEMARMLGWKAPGKGEDEEAAGPWAPFIQRGLDLVERVTERRAEQEQEQQQPAAAQQPSRRVATAPAPERPRPQPQAAPVQQEQEQEKIAKDIILQVVNSLVEAKSAGLNPEMTAELARENIPAEALEGLLQYEASEVLHSVDEKGLLPAALSTAEGRAYATAVWSAARGRK